MRGEVEIWRGDELIHKESNLLVDGAGESIVDMLTVSPSLSGIPSASALLDTSNYTIQAISFGKDASAYQFNAHALPYRRNLWYNSTPSSESGNDVTFGNDLIVSSRPDITPPPQYAYVPSSTAHVLSLEDKNDDTNSVLQMYLYSSTHNSDTTTSAGQDQWICASVYVKFPIDFSTLVPVQDTDTTFRHPRTHLGMSIYGEGRDLAGDYSRGGLGHSRLGTVSNWNDTGTTPEADGSAPSAINFSYANAPEFGTARSEGSGYSINNWQQNGGVVPVGEGWHRIWAAGLAPVSGVSGIATTLYPIGWENDPYGETQGGIYMYGAQIELGRWPTDLDFSNNRQINNWDMSGSVLNRDHVPGAPTDNGTVRALLGNTPNPNLLFYTDDPGGSPGLSWGPTVDAVGEYWQVNSTSYVWSFSSVATAGANPQGVSKVIEFSSVDVTPTGSLPMILNRMTSSIPGLADKDTLTWKEGYQTTVSWYVKKPSSNAVSSFSIALYDHGGPPPSEAANNKIEWEWDGTVPSHKSYGTAYKTYGQEAVGNDWYRMHMSISGLGDGAPGDGGQTVAGDPIQTYFYMGTDAPVAGSERSVATSNKRIWLSSPQIEQWPIGTKTAPTPYRVVTGPSPTSSENTLVASSYTPTNYLSSPPNPNSTRVEDGDTALLDLSSDTLRNFNMGQNLNVIPYRKNPGGPFGKGPINGSMELFPHNVPHGSEQITWMKNYESSFFPGPNGELSGLGSFGPQGYYLGCYPEGSSTGGSTFALVSSLDNSAAYLGLADASSSPYYVHGTYNSIVNEASSMDVSGFVGKVYDPQYVVGTVANPNLCKYTENFADDPGISFNSDLTGVFWQFTSNEDGDQRWGSTSSILETNPFGGPSSIQLSATGEASDIDYYPIMSTITNVTTLDSTKNITYSLYVKQPTGASGVNRFGLNLYNASESDSTTLWYNFSGTAHGYAANGTPVLTTTGATSFSNYTGSKIEDAGNAWWRIIHSISGVGDEVAWTNGDGIRIYTYLNMVGYSPENTDTYSLLAGSGLWISSPQCEQHPIAWNLSATPYQAVSGASPLVSEGKGEGGLHVSGGHDTTNSGTVEYSITVGSGDVGYSNLYGGIYNMGLWTIDTEASRRAGNMAPYSFGPLDNPRKYKLFATKHLTKNLGFIEDSGTDPGCLNYSDLTIKWRIHFT